MTNDGTFDVGIDTRAAVRAHREAPWTENPVGAVQKGSLSVIYVGLSRNLKEIRPKFPAPRRSSMSPLLLILILLLLFGGGGGYYAYGPYGGIGIGGIVLIILIVLLLTGRL